MAGDLVSVSFAVSCVADFFVRFSLAETACLSLGVGFVDTSFVVSFVEERTFCLQKDQIPNCGCRYYDSCFSYRCTK